MATLTGQFISQSYSGIIQLSTNTGIITGSSTQLQDGLGTNLGVWINGQGRISGSAITSSADSLFNGVTVGKGGGNVSSNTAVGNEALISNIADGIDNTAMGLYTLRFNSIGDYNTALGAYALNNNTSGSNNTALGRTALLSNITGTNNTAVGRGALGTNQTGSNSTAIGYLALQNNTVSDNTAVGSEALRFNTTGQANTAIGYNTGDGITTGNYNTILGASVTGLSSSLSNNIILADGQGNIKLRYSGSWTYSGSIAGEVRALTITSQTASVDLSTANLFTLTLVSGSTTNINPTNIRLGQTSMIKITQPAGGGGSVSFNSAVKFPSGLAYTASIGSNVVDTISFASKISLFGL